MRWGHSHVDYSVQGLRVRPDRLTIHLSPDRQEDAQVTVTAKGGWKLAAAQQDVKLNALKQGVQLKLPAGTVQVMLVPLCRS